MAPPLGYDDFADSGLELEAPDIQIINEFEELWKEYLQANPNILPTGMKGKRIASLEVKIQGLQVAKQNVQTELQHQLEFFAQSKDQMKDNFEREKEQSERVYEQMIEDMQTKLDAIRTSTRNLEANGDWELFMDALNDAVEQSEVLPLPGDGLSTVLGVASHLPSRAKGNVMKPSAKAMFLNNVVADSDVHVNSRDFLLRAYRIDHVLLQAQVKVLQRDVERMEHNAETMELVGKFLTEQNIWGLFSASSNASMTGTTSKVNGVDSNTTRWSKKT